MLADHVLTRNVPELQDTKTHIILSSSFPGGVRYMRQQYYDSMAIVRQFGKPDLFITVTTNPKWPEIQDSLLPGQTASDQPDIVARVFKMKLKALLEDIVKNRVFGGLQAYVCVIEFQKRGLPHAHISVILSGDSKPRSSADYDRFKYNCHVNMEICSTVQSMKYLYKYVYKGQDRATVALRGRRERGGRTAGNTNVNNEEEAVDEI
ncbi:hypothetical protein PC114_g18856 [Phytophthora cactorum]|nr:hypothetical protein PC114_g18856 [Phytophthora cactorum]